MIKNILKYIIFLIIIAGLIYSLSCVISKNSNNQRQKSTSYKYSENGFYYEDDSANFTNQWHGKKCKGIIKFPYLMIDEEVGDLINDEIHKFALSYVICNTGKYAYYSQEYEIPNSSSLDAFSIKFVTYKKFKKKKQKTLWRIDSLNFNIQTGKEINVIDDIFNNLARNMIPELVGISQGYLEDNISWEQFKAKVANRDIQFYISENKWYIVFNSTENKKGMIEVEIPEYFMQGEDTDVTSAR